MTEAGTLPLLVALLRAGNDEAKHSAARALGSIMFEAALHFRAEVGVLPPFVALIQTGSAEAKAKAADALRSIARGRIALRSRVAEAGALPPLVALLQAGSAKAKCHAAVIFAVLASDGSLCRALTDCCPVLPLVALCDDSAASAIAKLWLPKVR